jgi:exosortase
VIAACAPVPYWVRLAVPAVVALVLYGPLLPDMIAEWATHPSLSHGFAIPLIAAYLVGSRMSRLAPVPPTPAFSGLPVLAGGLSLLVLGVRGDEAFLARISLPITILGLALIFAGAHVTRHVWPGIAYLTFMVPLPWTTVKAVAYQDQLLVAGIAAKVLPWLAVPVYRDGVLLQLPNITLEVADLCSSVPALAALLSLGIAYATLTIRPLPMRIVLIGVTVPLAVASNAIRVTLTAAGVYYLGPWTLASAFHAFAGTVNFVFTFAFLLALDTLLPRIPRSR